MDKEINNNLLECMIKTQIEESSMVYEKGAGDESYDGEETEIVTLEQFKEDLKQKRFEEQHKKYAILPNEPNNTIN